MHVLTRLLLYGLLNWGGTVVELAIVKLHNDDLHYNLASLDNMTLKL